MQLKQKEIKDFETIKEISKKSELTVIVPNYNHGIYLKKIRDNLKKATSIKILIIMVDDCSTDDSRDIIKDICNNNNNNNHNYQYIFNTKNLGVIESIKRISKMIESKYLFFYSADDNIEYELLEKGVSALNNDEENVGYFISSVISNVVTKEFSKKKGHPINLRYVNWIKNKKSITLKEIKNIMMFQLLLQYIPGGNTIIYKTKVFHEFNKQPSIYGGLIDLFTNILIASKYGYIFDYRYLGEFQITESSYSSKQRRSSKEFINSIFCFVENELDTSKRGLFISISTSIIVLPWVIKSKNNILQLIRLLFKKSNISLTKKLIFIITLLVNIPFLLANRLVLH
tara:strand:- start:4412 stop:5440 length:1029 start_codon:yes stop_codon:yes gene_type:complete